MADPFASTRDTPSAFGLRGRNVTPAGADVDLVDIPKGVLCLTAGTLAYVPAGNADADVISLEIPAGYMPPHRPRRIKAATTCTVWTVE